MDESDISIFIVWGNKMKRFSELATTAALLIASACAAPAMAAVGLSTGAGSAVTTVDAMADFESINALNDNPYLEGGLEFSRTSLSFNNNSCGFAGCNFHAPFGVFSGNYMYGVGEGGFFDIRTTGGNIFSGLEFIVSTGYPNEDPQDVSWEAFLNNVSVGSGSTTLAVGTVVGFSGGAFDQLRYTSNRPVDQEAPAFDSVRAQYSGSGPVPEPATWAMMIIGFGAAGSMIRRSRASIA